MALALSLVARAEDAARTYDIKIEQKPVVGQKTDSVKTTSMKTKMKMVQDGQVLKEEGKEENGSYEFTCEVTAVDGDEMTGATWTFRKATHLEGGQPVAWGFEGKTVTGKLGEDGAWEFACEDESELSEEEVAGIKDATGKKKKKGKDEPDMDDVFKPKNPVKVGESWSPDLEALAKSFGGDNLKVDVEDSKATCTLKSVETRDGATCGTILVDIDLSIGSIPPMTFNEPFHFAIAFKLDVCIDGSRPDGKMSATLKLDGTRKATMKQGKQTMNCDMSLGLDGVMEETRKAAK